MGEYPALSDEDIKTIGVQLGVTLESGEHLDIVLGVEHLGTVT